MATFLINMCWYIFFLILLHFFVFFAFYEFNSIYAFFVFFLQITKNTKNNSSLNKSPFKISCKKKCRKKIGKHAGDFNQEKKVLEIWWWLLFEEILLLFQKNMEASTKEIEKNLTLTHFILNKQKSQFPEATGQLSILLHGIEIASKYISSKVRAAGILCVRHPG
jgi:hypothetical protein